MRRDFHELVRRRVCEPAGMLDTAFLRSDELPGRAALGYLERRRVADEHLPSAGARQRGRRDLFDSGGYQRAVGRRCSPAGSCPRDSVAEMVRPRSDVPSESRRYGLGFWLHASSDVVMLHGIRRRRVILEHARPGARNHTKVIANGLTVPGRSPSCSKRQTKPDVRPTDSDGRYGLHLRTTSQQPSRPIGGVSMERETPHNWSEQASRRGCHPRRSTRLNPPPSS